MQIRNLYEEITNFLMIFLKLSSNVHNILIYAFLLTINACTFNAFSIIKIYKSGSISAKVEKNAFKCFIGKNYSQEIPQNNFVIFRCKKV